MIKRSKKKKDFDEIGFKGALNYIRESKFQIYAVIALFFISAFLGFFNGKELTFFDAFLKELVDKTNDLRGIGLISFIFLNNVQSSFLGMIFGIVLGIFPVMNAVLNGGILGYVFYRVYEVSGFTEFWRILPHGVFELPAIFISLGLGLRLGAFIFAKEKWKELKKGIFNSLNVFVNIVLPLLIIAAIIEGSLIGLLK